MAFDLQLSDGSTLAINEVVRVVPNKRLVCKAVWNDQNVYVKLFIGAQAKKYARRDKQGVQALIADRIATPNLLYAGKVNAMEALIFNAIEPAQNAEVLYQQLMKLQPASQADQKAARLNLMLKLTQTLAQLHNANLLQTDLYFKNFLVDAETVHTIDGDGIRSISPLFKQSQKHRNLATLWSKMDALDFRWIADCYAQYCADTQTQFSAPELAKIAELAQKIRQKAASAYADKKVFRSCADVKVRQSFKQFSAFSSDFNAIDLSVKQLDLALSDAQNRLKSGNTCTVGSAFIADKNVVIKRYNIKNIWHGLKLSISQSRAAKSWANAHRLNILNIPTAKPLLLLEQRFGWLRGRAYFLSECIDAPDIGLFFAITNTMQKKEKVAYETALLFYKLSLLQISHGDCKASNIKIVDGQPVLIDLDSMQAHQANWWFEKKHIKDLKRFMKNWADDQHTTDIFRKAFECAYAEAGGNLALINQV